MCLLCLHYSIVTARHPPANDRSDACAVTPGDALRETILDVAASGRPAWSVMYGVKVPRLELVPVDVPYGNGRAYISPGESLDRGPRRAVLRDATLLAIETQHPDLVEKANRDPKAEAQLRQLAGAALHDICGLPYFDRGAPCVADALGLGSERAAQRVVSTGRRLWPTLAAWPWWLLNPRGGRLPAKWWTQPRVLETFAVWRSG